MITTSTTSSTIGTFLSSSTTLLLLNASTSLDVQRETNEGKEATHKCNFCDEVFMSRNTLFRHINNSKCSERQRRRQAQEEEGVEVEVDKTESATVATNSVRKKFNNNNDLGKRQTLGFRFAYFCPSATTTTTAKSTTIPEAQLVSQLIQDALRGAMTNLHQKKINRDNSSIQFQFDILSITQSSVANQRHTSLSQEVGCGASNDFMTISFLDSNLPLDDNDNKNDSQKKDKFDNLLKEMNTLLEGDVETSAACHIMTIRLLHISHITSSTFHSENSCTQLVYHYMLPLKWLKDGQDLERWWLLSENDDSHDKTTTNDHDIDNIITIHNSQKKQHPGAFQTKPPSSSLKLLKSILKNAESITIPNRRVRRKSLLQEETTESKNRDERKIEKVTKRKLGTLSNKEQRAWHNFADPNLRGDASPNQEPVWRVLDKIRIDQIRRNPFNDEVVAIIEFQGDAFLPQQIRRIVGTAVGISNGILPENTFDVATRPDVAIETILSPPNRLYLRDARFHFDESKDNIFGFVSDDTKGKLDTQMKNKFWVQEQIFSHTSNKEMVEMENNWLLNLKKNIAPRICNQMHLLDKCYEPTEESKILEPAPKVYTKTLYLLRDIVQSGEWPTTSIARSKVIRNVNKSQVTKNQSTDEKFGSFTIVNPKLFQITPTQSLPLGNHLFAELVEYIFRLEEDLSKQTLSRAKDTSAGSVNREVERKPSTHCAVNFNASFTPHVDSGTGLGQSLSMIVGLGDYYGGEILVEGDPYSIRYKPLEFDGWKQRHWTGAYTGERFSLVYFTPEIKDNTK